jgi:signal transduction histidine kinase
MPTSVEQEYWEYLMDEYRWYKAHLPLTDIQGKQPIAAVLMLGWPRTMSSPQKIVIEEVQSMLLFVEDTIATAMTNVLLAERVQEFEDTAYQEAIAAIEQVKSELLGTMSHELRGPLASIKGYTATLLRYDKRLRHEEQREFLEAIRDASDDLSTLVDRLLEMAQYEADAIQLRSSPVDMLYLTREAIDHAEHSRHYTQAIAAHPDRPGFFTFRVNVTDEQGQLADTIPLVWADPRRIREVLDNILENAMKFSPDGGVITVTLRPVTSPPPEYARSNDGKTPVLPAFPATSVTPLLPMLEISIHDQGISIANEHLVRIFDRFQRVDTRLTREVNGLGLGLAICKCIVALHNGSVWAESQPGKGSTFYIRLPLAQ